jgi:hypothetical protein
VKLGLARWSLVLLCASMAVAVGGGFYEGLIVMPLWSRSPSSSFSIVQPGTGVPLQTFWIPVHVPHLVAGAAGSHLPGELLPRPPSPAAAAAAALHPVTRLVSA